MRDSDRSRGGVSRRTALQRALGAGVAGAAGAGATRTVGAQENDTQGNETQDGGQQDGELDWGDWFEDVENYEETEDLRGEESVTVAVGAGNGLLFDPPAIWVDEGTTVTWEWTGEGGAHNVEHEGDEFVSETVDEEGFTFEHTFEESGQFPYFCNPHRGVGMKGGVAVGDDPGTAGTGEGSAGGAEEGGSPILLFVAAAFVAAFLSPLAFLLVVYARGKGGREVEYRP